MDTLTTKVPIPGNEIGRLVSLSDLDIDYSCLNDSYRDLTRLAAKITGAPISAINLIDSFTQWTIAGHGLSPGQIPREESICQYTIVEKEYLEVKNLREDNRFKEKTFLANKSDFRYYFGTPITTEDGYNIGAICVLDKVEHEISPEKVDLLKIVAREIIHRLKVSKIVDTLKTQVIDERATKIKVAHDIRGPLSGIIGLAQLICEQDDKNKLENVLELITMIYKSGKSLLELTEEILSEDRKSSTTDNTFNLLALKEKLLQLYYPQALSKNIIFEVNTGLNAAETPISKNKLLQIAGNIISNAIKFTPPYGKVTVKLDAVANYSGKVILHIVVSDSGIGLDEKTVQCILRGEVTSTDGTCGENGYGFGMQLVKQMVCSLKGIMEIYSKEGEGSTFHILLPQ